MLRVMAPKMIDKSRGKLTVAQIAEVAGVSVATVSRVINQSAEVSEPATAAVRAAIEKMNYTPRTRARRGSPRLQYGRVGFVTFGYDGETWRDLPVLLDTMAGASQQARELGLSFQVEALNNEQFDSHVLRDRTVDGAILLAAEFMTEEHLARLAPAVPLVQVMGWPNGPRPFDLIAFSNMEVGAIAFRYLEEKGCRSLAFLTSYANRTFTRWRAYAFADAAAAGGYQIQHFATEHNATYARLFGDRVTWEASPEKLVDVLLKEMPSPLGIFVPTDHEAVLFCRQLARCGMQVGRDVFVCSCDNEKVRLSALEFPPATIDVRAFDIGRMAVRRLIARLQNPSDPASVIELQPSLVLPKAATEPR